MGVGPGKGVRSGGGGGGRGGRECVPLWRIRLAATQPRDRLVGLVVKASASRVEGPGFESRLRRDFSGVESYQ